MRQSMRGVRPETETLSEGDPFLDELSEEALFDTLLDSQAKAIGALKSASGALRTAINGAVSVLEKPGSRLIYCGAGTSGRVALLDAVELNPTFNWPDSRIRILLAGGEESFFEAKEGAEDDGEAARRALSNIEPGRNDVLVGIAASGTTPFVLAAVEAARDAGCLTLGFSNNAGSPLLDLVAHPVLLDTGAEALAGSTRLTAGTSQKIALNIFSTALMVRLGRVYKGRMVDMRVTNRKLALRANRIVRDIVGCSEEKAASALVATGNDIKAAVLVAFGASVQQAKDALNASERRLPQSLSMLFGEKQGQTHR